MTVKVSTGVQGPTGAPGLGFPLAPVTVLPGSPTDGQIVLFQSAAMATAGIVWMLRYRAAGGTYKWESLGGSSLYNEAGAQVNTSSDALVTLAGGPLLTIPLAGEYDVQAWFSGGLYSATSGGSALAQLTYNAGQLGQILRAGVEENIGADGTRFSDAGKTQRLTLSPANQALELRYRRDCAGGSATGGAYFEGRILAARPVRVG